MLCVTIDCNRRCFISNTQYFIFGELPESTRWRDAYNSDCQTREFDKCSSRKGHKPPGELNDTNVIQGGGG